MHIQNYDENETAGMCIVLTIGQETGNGSDRSNHKSLII